MIDKFKIIEIVRRLSEGKNVVTCVFWNSLKFDQPTSYHCINYCKHRKICKLFQEKYNGKEK